VDVVPRKSNPHVANRYRQRCRRHAHRAVGRITGGLAIS
jgi:hypothetical protein